MREVQFIRSPAQGNIYSTTRVGKVTLIGSGNYGRILAHVNPRALEEVPLTSIPVGSDIIAVDACQESFHIIGVTFIQKTQIGIEEVKTAYLNFYSTWTSYPEDEVSPSAAHSRLGSDTPASPSTYDSNIRQLLSTIGQKCVQFKLNFVPYHLYHCPVQKPNGAYESVFLLSGSDHRIHVYEPNEEGKTFSQVPTSVYFPELDGTFPSIVTRMQIELLHDLKKRITICGCEDGQLKSFIVAESEIMKSNSSSTVYSKQVSHDKDLGPEGLQNPEAPRVQVGNEIEGATGGDSIIGDCLISSQNEDLDFGRAVQKNSSTFDGIITSVQVYTDGCSVNAVVSSSNSPVFIFTDILTENFGQGLSLKFSSRWDAIETVCVADIDFDGHAEIIVGTFGCTLLVYKFMDQVKQWVIVAHRKFPSTIYSVEFFDYHLYIVTASGLHIIEYSKEAYFYKYGVEPSAELMKQYADDIKNSWKEHEEE